MRCNFNKKTIGAVLTNTVSSFEGGNIQAHVLSYRIDLYFHGYKLVIKFDENRHSNRILTTK